MEEILKLDEKRKEDIKEFNINYAKYILEKRKNGEITFTFTSSRSYKIPNTNIKLESIKGISYVSIFKR